MFKILFAKEGHRRLLKYSVLNTVLEKIFRYYEDLPEVLVIPKEAIKTNEGNFKGYFSFMAFFLLDSNADNFDLEDSGNLNVNCPLIRKGKPIPLETMQQFTVDSQERNMHQKIQEKALSNQFNNIPCSPILIDATNYLRLKTQGISQDEFMPWIIIKPVHWFTSELFINSFKNINEIEEAIQFARKNDFAMPEKEEKEIESKLTSKHENS